MTRLTILFQFGIILLINSCGGQDSPFDSAKKSIDKKDYEAAIVMLNKIIEEKPNFDSAYIERGYAYMMIGDTRSAFDDYNHVISNPFLKINALDGRAQLYYTTGEYQKSLDDFSKIIKLDANNYLAYYGRGIAKMQLKIYGNNPDTTFRGVSSDENFKTFYYDYNGALNDFNKAIELNPKYIDLYVIRGDLYSKLSKNDKALGDYNSAIKIDSTNFDTYLQRGLLYKDIGESKKALADFDKAIQLNPQSPFPFVNRGYLKKEQLNDKDGACKDFNKAEELGISMSQEDKKYCN